MKKILHISVIALAALNMACKGFLDTVPQDAISPENFYRTDTDLNRAMAGIYDRLGDTRTYARGLYSYLVFSDEFFIKGQTTGMLSNTMDASTTEVIRCWEALYAGIDRANLLIDYIGNAEGSASPDKITEALAQAHFMRGYYHFLLADMYGPIPLRTTATKSAADKPLPRSPLSEVYEQIVKDMEYAAAHAKQITEYGYNGMASQTAIWGMLARVYLTMAGKPLQDPDAWERARYYADKVMQSGLHSLNPSFSRIFINHSEDKYDLQECLWEVEFFGKSEDVVKEGGSVGIYNGIYCPNTDNTITDSPYGYDYLHAHNKLYNIYEAADGRRDWTIAPYYFKAPTTGKSYVKTDWTAAQIYERSCGKWRREYENDLVLWSKDYNSTNFPLLRYADVLLMFAEADNELTATPSDEAYKALNRVRRRGYGKDVNTADASVDASGLGKTEFRALIKNERYREFAFEGLRKHDLVRWGDYVQVCSDLKSAVASDALASATFKTAIAIQLGNITARSVLFPVPNSERASNPEMPQNEGW